MLNLLDLPPEVRETFSFYFCTLSLIDSTLLALSLFFLGSLQLLMKIIEELRTDLYTAKERQTDLARIAQVSWLVDSSFRN